MFILKGDVFILINKESVASTHSLLSCDLIVRFPSGIRLSIAKEKSLFKGCLDALILTVVALYEVIFTVALVRVKEKPPGIAVCFT